MSETIDSTASGVGGAGTSSTIPPTAASTKAEPSTTASGTTPLTSSVLPKAIIKNVDMSEEMQQASVDIASEAMTKYTIEKDIAAYVKKAMDTKFGPTWHAVVGKNYGSYVTHETKHFIYFYLGQIAFLLWRA